jgi:hypothetical protein
MMQDGMIGRRVALRVLREREIVNLSAVPVELAV